MKYIISGGGTGGHIYPALAIFDELKKRDPEGEFLYVGTRDGLEKELAYRAGYDYASVRVRGLPRSISIESLKTGIELIKGLIDANKILKEFEPDVVIGTGGYVAFPIVFLAQLKGIKTVLQEANAFPGKVNRLLARKADAIAIAFKETGDRLQNDNIFMSGNPIRPEFLKIGKTESRKELGIAEDEKLVLSFGGSGGQESINEVILGILSEKDFKYRLIHITGRNYFQKFLNKLREKSINLNRRIEILDYSHEIPKLLSACDLAILSSSAISIAEVSVLGTPSILIPKSYTADNHQEYNARSCENVGASKMILEKDLTPQSLYQAIEEILEDDIKMKKMGECAKIHSNPKSTEVIVDRILALIK